MGFPGRYSFTPRLEFGRFKLEIPDFEKPHFLASFKAVASGQSAKIAGTLTGTFTLDGGTATVDAVATATDDDIGVEAIGSAAARGETGKASVAIDATADEDAAGPDLVATSVAKAAADVGDGDTVDATARTDAEAFDDDDLSVVVERRTVESDGDRPTAMSFTHLEATQLSAMSVSDFGQIWSIFDDWA